MAWAPGDVVEYRDMRLGRPWWVVPARVVEDSADAVVLWWPAGTVYQRIVHESRLGALAKLAAGTWQLEDVEWWGGDSLLVIPPGAPYAVWPYRTHDHELVGWYLNLQAPLTRTDRGFDTNDWTLDVVASPDLSGWMWKDEDELEEGRRLGLYSDADIAQIRAAGEAAIAVIEARDPIFDRWRDWRPDPTWVAPQLPG